MFESPTKHATRTNIIQYRVKNMNVEIVFFGLVYRHAQDVSRNTEKWASLMD